MRKQMQSFWSAAVLIAVLGVVGWSSQLQAQRTPTGGGAAGQSPTQSTPPQAQQQPYPGQAAPGQQPEQPGAAADPQGGQMGGVQVFTGQVVKVGDKYMLQDAGGTTYDIDHQDIVRQYEGKKVRVNGTLDPSGKMIHIQGGGQH